MCANPTKKILNRTLAIDSPFQIFAVGLLVEFIALPLLSPETVSSFSKLRIFLFNVHLALFVRRMIIKTVAKFHRKVLSLSKLILELALEAVKAI